MEKEWVFRPPENIPGELLKHLGNNTTVASYLVQRGFLTTVAADQFLKPDPLNLSDPNELPDMKIAADRVIKAINSRERIGIWGDFDVDGQTATAILVECFRKLGTEAVYHLPDRRKESHGISLGSLKNFLTNNIQLLITCDTGISEFESIAYAMHHGVDVIVTDHHALPENLPPALACINPHRLIDGHTLGSLSGSGVAFELMLAVCRLLDREGLALESIDLAAIGLIADMAPLRGDSRLLTQLGLKQLSEKPRRCIQALSNAGNVGQQTIDEQVIGYSIAPRLNAVGRLEDANPVVELLMDTLPEPKMKDLVEHINTINADRKWLSDQVYRAALDQFQRQRDAIDQPVIILSNPTWTGGVLGLAAGQLAREFNRPAIVLSESPDGILKGSARSVEGVDITAAIASASEYLGGFGGHPMAAGLSFSLDQSPSVKHKIYRHVLDQGFDPEKPAVLEIDAELSFSNISSEFYQEINQLAPFGNANPPLVFCSRNNRIISKKSLGRTREHFQLQLEDETGNSFPSKWWNTEESRIPGGIFDLAYSLKTNTHKGETTLEAIWIDFHPCKEPEVEVLTPDTNRIIDLRLEYDSLSRVLSGQAQTSFLVFREPPPMDNPDFSGRCGLHRVKTLILDSIPPSSQILQNVIHETAPEKIILVFSQTGNITTGIFLRHLAGLVQYAVSHREGLASLTDLAQAMNSTENVVKTGLEWLSASGKIMIPSHDYDLYRLEIASHPVNEIEKKALEMRLRFQLDEVAAFKKHLSSLPATTFNSMI